MIKIAIFGTSADPPTIAHQSILQWLGDNFDLVVVYASNNPFKQHLTTLDQRSEMLNLLITDLKHTHHNIKLCQEISDRRSLNTINKAIEKWGIDKEYFLVIGSDLIPQIASWYLIEKLLQKVTILIMPRPNFNLDEKGIIKIEELGGKYQIATDAILPPISSTKYRQNKEEKILSKKIINYIRKNALYQ